MGIPLAGTIHRHYKGGRYFVVAIAETHEHNGDKDVVYISLKYGKYCTRPLTRDSRAQDAWTDKVQWPDGTLRQRFIPDDEQPLDFFEKMFPQGES